MSVPPSSRRKRANMESAPKNDRPDQHLAPPCVGADLDRPGKTPSPSLNGRSCHPPAVTTNFGRTTAATRSEQGNLPLAVAAGPPLRCLGLAARATTRPTQTSVWQLSRACPPGLSAHPPTTGRPRRIAATQWHRRSAQAVRRGSNPILIAFLSINNPTPSSYRSSGMM